jgi:hypothetical protein
MTSDPCAELRRWLARPDAHAPPDAALVAHVASCPRCRGELATMLAGLLDAPLADDPSCDACADDLPAYAELVQMQGELVAARHYPAIWWHFWTCPNCAALAEDLATLLAAEAAGELAPPRLREKPAPPAALALPPIRLGREFLHAVFAPQQVLGAAWNGDGDQLFLAEETLPGYRLTIHVRQEGPDHWALEVSIEPPVGGALVVRFAETVFRAPLVGGHTGRVSGIPAALLTDHAGPDMQLAIEREAGHLGEHYP